MTNRPDILLSTGTIVRHATDGSVTTAATDTGEMSDYEWNEYQDRILGRWATRVEIMRKACAKGVFHTRGALDVSVAAELARRGLLQHAGGRRYEPTIAAMAVVAHENKVR